jgi:predicted TIM-barrel fold metal-dependent hydrolase
VVPEGGENAWPYTSTGAQLRQLVDAFGAERVVWGSDFPFVLNECGYAPAAGIVRACGAGLSEEEIAAVMGGNLQRMFPGGWS